MAPDQPRTGAVIGGVVIDAQVRHNMMHNSGGSHCMCAGPAVEALVDLLDALDAYPVKRNYGIWSLVREPYERACQLVRADG